VILVRALITGASSGIGREIAIYLDSLGYETILVARDKVALEDLQVKYVKNRPKYNRPRNQRHGMDS